MTWHSSCRSLVCAPQTHPAAGLGEGDEGDGRDQVELVGAAELVCQRLVGAALGTLADIGRGRHPAGVDRTACLLQKHHGVDGVGVIEQGDVHRVQGLGEVLGRVAESVYRGEVGASGARRDCL